MSASEDLPLISRSLKPTCDDEKFMIEALKEAEKAFALNEVPIGAVLVHDSQVIARGHNQVEMLKDATAHAEMLCITSGEVAMDNWRLLNTTLYTTIEPCSMCAGAIFLTRIPRIVWGAPDMRHGAGGSWTDLFAMRHPTHSVSVTKGIYENEAGYLLKIFFEKRREK